MVWFGKVKDGKILVEPGTQLPEGTIVRIEPIDQADTVDSVYRLGDDAVDDPLSPDLASQHDHFIYGTPRREA